MEVVNKIADLINSEFGESVIRVTYPYNDYDVEDLIDRMPGRELHDEDGWWTVPLREENIVALANAGFEIDNRLKQFIQGVRTEEHKIFDGGIPGLRKKLFPYQAAGVKFIDTNKGRALIADEMGLGKTVQALAWLQLHPEIRPAIVVVPASLKLNWKKEAEAWMPDPRTDIISGKKIRNVSGQIIIINYDVLYEWVERLQELEALALIIDEAHYIKSMSARRTKAVKRMAKGIPNVIALSGTPILNRPIEIYNTIRVINEGLFPNYKGYARRYCNLRYNGFGWDMSGATNTAELHQILSRTIMIRRTKAEVLKELPEKLYSFVPIEISNKTEYRKAERDFINFILEKKGSVAALRAASAEALTTIEGLKQLSVRGKMKQCIEWIQNFLEVDGKLVVFAVHKFVIDELMEAFKDVAVKIDGSVTAADRQIAVDRFQEDDNVRLFVGNIQAAGVGITLTAASNVAFLEYPWSPGLLSQAIDRCHRIGQKDAVNVHYLLALDTIEEKIAKMLDEKRTVLDAVLDGTAPASESLITEIMNSYEQIDTPQVEKNRSDN
jgi:SNF2 family DNA or RNA helicase